MPQVRLATAGGALAFARKRPAAAVQEDRRCSLSDLGERCVEKPLPAQVMQSGIEKGGGRNQAPLAWVTWRTVLRALEVDNGRFLKNYSG